MCEDEKKPPFKPGDTPYCFLGDELLNGNIDWKQRLIDVIYHGPHGFGQLAKLLDVSQAALTKLFTYGDFRCLNCKRAAILNTLHTRYVPQRGEHD